MRRLLPAVASLWLCACGPSTPSTPSIDKFFPADNEVGSWAADTTVATPGVQVAKSNSAIEALVNGDAAPFEAKGTLALGWNRYKSGSSKLDVRVWQMKSAADATDTYGYLVTDVSLYKANTWTTLSGVGEDGRIADTGGSWWLNARKGVYIVELRITPNGTQPRADVEAFAKAVIGKMP